MLNKYRKVRNKLKKTIMITILGNNRSSEWITENKFPIDNMLSKYNVHFTSNVTNREKTHSCLFYESLRAVNMCGCADPSKIDFIFARGCIGKRTEREIYNKLIMLDLDANIILIAKSFGVIDSLRMLKKKLRLNISLAIFIDGYATYFHRRSVSKKYKINGKKERRLTLPNSIDHVFNIVQRTKGFKGLLAGVPNEYGVVNKIITPDQVNGLYYDHYENAERIPLKVEHAHMDEIAMTLPLYFNITFQQYLETHYLYE